MGKSGSIPVAWTFILEAFESGKICFWRASQLSKEVRRNRKKSKARCPDQIDPGGMEGSAGSLSEQRGFLPEIAAQISQPVFLPGGLAKPILLKKVFLCGMLQALEERELAGPRAGPISSKPSSIDVVLLALVFCERSLKMKHLVKWGWLVVMGWMICGFVHQAVAQPTKTHKKPRRRPDVIFVPTPEDVVEKMLELAEVTKDDVVYDLGCGDGRIVVTAAKKYGCKAVGIDIDPQRVKESLERVKKYKVEHLVTIKEGDIFQEDLTPATVVTLYLLPSLNVKLIPQLQKLKPGARIVSHSFDMEGVKPEKVVHYEAKDGITHTLYLWRTPLQLEKKDQQEK